MGLPRNALQILNTVEDELGLSRSAAVTADAINTRQLLAFMNASVEEMNLDGDWSGLEQEAIIDFGPPTVLTASLTESSATAIVADTSFLTVPASWVVSGDGLLNGTRVLAAPDATTVTLDRWADETGNFELTFVRDTYALPDDYARWIPDTHWDVRMMWAMIGPTSSQFDAFQRNGIVGPFPRRQYRKQGAFPNCFRIFPPPTSVGSYPGTLSYRYISEYSVLASDLTTKRFFTANDDIAPALPDRVVILGAKWRWQQAKGFDFGPLQAEFYNWFDNTLSNDSGPPVLRLDATGDWGDIGLRGRVQDGNFPGPS